MITTQNIYKADSDIPPGVLPNPIPPTPVPAPDPGPPIPIVLPPPHPHIEAMKKEYSGHPRIIALLNDLERLLDHKP